MPSGIYKRKKRTKARKANPTRRAATKRGPGRPPKAKRGRPAGSKTKAKAPAIAARPRVRARKAAGRPAIDTFVIALHQLNQLIDQRSKLLIEAINGISDTLQENEKIRTETKADAAPADTPLGASQGEPAPVSQ